MTRRFAPMLMAFGVVASAVAIATPAHSQDPKVINTVTYRCDEGKGFIAEYRDNETVRTTFGSKVIELPQQEAASGTRYGNGSVTLYSKGKTAFVEVGENRLFNNCVETGRVSGLW